MADDPSLDHARILPPKCARPMTPPRARLIAVFALGVVVALSVVWLSGKLPFRKKPPADLVARAVQSGDTRLLDEAATAPVDPNVSGTDGRPPLLIATQQRDADMITRLLELGANVDAADGDGLTPIMLAAAQGDLALLRKFSERSQKLDAADSCGRTALHHAVLAGQAEAVQLLLPSLPDLTKPLADGRDLLTVACESANPEIIRAAFSRAPEGLLWTPATRAALKVALAAKDPDFLRLVLSKHPTPPTTEGGNTPLLAEAIATENAELFNALLAAGADPNTSIPAPVEKSFVAHIKSDDLRDYLRGDEGMSVLMIAAGLGKAEYIRALLDAGADRNRLTKRHKMLALYFAAHSQKPKCIQMLLGRGPTPDELRVEISLATQRASVIKDGKSILQTAISTGRKGFDTPAGEYVITDKDRDHRSTIYKVDMPYFMRLNCRDFGLHAGVVPRYPASHGCIRLPPEIAQKLFTEIPVGTVVTIN